VAVKELLRTNDVVLLSWAEALLKDAGIATFVLDRHTSILEGSIGALPRRLMVDDGDVAAARHVLGEAEIPLSEAGK
jgi:hypothetical protein